MSDMAVEAASSHGPVRARALRRWPALRAAALYAGLSVVAILVVFPLLYALATSLLTAGEAAAYPPRLLPSGLRVENYLQALRQAPLPRYLLNSVIQSSSVTLGQLATASLAGFAFAFLQIPGKQFLFFVFLATLMIPWEATIIPNYLLIRSMGWADTYQGLTVPFLATAFGTFLLRQFFMTIPKDLYDAATIDGCGSFRFLTTIALPLARPALGTLAVYAFLQTYNQYLWPLLITSNAHMRTVQIGIALLQDEERFALNVVMAGVVIVLLPTFVLFALGNRQLIRGLTAGAFK